MTLKPSSGRDNALGLCERNRHELADAALGHGDAEEAVHAGHAHGVVGDDDKAGFGARAHLIQQPAEAVDVRVIKRGVDLVEHADRGGAGEEDGEDERGGRQRLLDAFTQVNTHFGSLFTALFGGGHAELRLTESDDPLSAGLEIYASPPGKRLGQLSLMSGGEQALTATALIFAVFLVNPAPICVLDEVDAPLDDANVDRFCTLMEKMASETATRFMVITHHPMTMARMNRLFGVTMGEKGVSQLVSVDLETAQKFTVAA